MPLALNDRNSLLLVNKKIYFILQCFRNLKKMQVHRSAASTLIISDVCPRPYIPHN